MRIIKEGKDKNKLPVFTCTRCGCEFECSKDEYYTDTTVTFCSCPPKYNAVASCPNCHKICITYVSSAPTINTDELWMAINVNNGTRKENNTNTDIDDYSLEDATCHSDITITPTYAKNIIGSKVKKVHEDSKSTTHHLAQGLEVGACKSSC